MWEEVQALIASKKQRNYEEAVRLLLDLRELDSRGGGGHFRERLVALRQTRCKKSKFIWGLERAGL